jgi:hypothetical protein
MTEYTHFEDSIPCGDSGLAVGAKGSEVTVVDSSGNVYSGGSTSAVPTYPTGHVSAGDKLVAYSGTAAITTGNAATIDTGLTAVTSAVVTRRVGRAGGAAPRASSLDPQFFNVYKTGGTLVVRAYGITTKASNDGNPTFRAATLNCSLDWIAWGT